MGNALLSIIQAAGWPIWPLILCSIVAVALIIERFTSLRPVRVAPPKLLEEVVAVTRTALPSSDVISRLADSSVLGRVLANGIRAVVADARINETGLRNAFELAGREAMHQLERYLNALATISTAAPLLGLLGTVIGMIEIFAAQNTGGGVANPQQLAYGISIALYNTAFGLIIAIPALMFYRYFRGVVNDYRMSMEQAAERMVPLLMRHTIGRTGGHAA
jgi:biopolymer transport protein ExbB